MFINTLTVSVQTLAEAIRREWSTFIAELQGIEREFSFIALISIYTKHHCIKLLRKERSLPEQLSVHPTTERLYLVFAYLYFKSIESGTGTVTGCLKYRVILPSSENETTSWGYLVDSISKSSLSLFLLRNTHITSYYCHRYSIFQCQLLFSGMFGFKSHRSFKAASDTTLYSAFVVEHQRLRTNLDCSVLSGFMT